MFDKIVLPRLAVLCAGLCVAVAAQADSTTSTSSASSAGSASSGSVSDSFHGSSNSSSGRDKKDAAADYRIIDVARAEGREGFARLTLQGDDPGQRLVLDLPQKIVDKERLAAGETVRSRPQVYGYEFARAGAEEAFFLVLADEWFGDLAARPVAVPAAERTTRL